MQRRNLLASEQFLLQLMESPVNWPEELKYINKCIGDAVDLFLDIDADDVDEANADISNKVQIRHLDSMHPAFKKDG